MKVIATHTWSDRAGRPDFFWSKYDTIETYLTRDTAEQIARKHVERNGPRLYTGTVVVRPADERNAQDTGFGFGYQVYVFNVTGEEPPPPVKKLVLTPAL